jgi:hypothetical protein
MTGWTIEKSPQVYARTAGTMYLLIILFGGFAEGFVFNALIAPGDAAATARHIVASSGLWNLGVAADLIVPVIAVPQVWIAWLLLRPAGRNLALLFVFFNAISLSVEAVSKLFLLMVLPLLSTAGHAGGLEPRQLYATVGVLLSAHTICFNIALLFFSGDCLVTGYLIFKAGYFPQALGVLMQIAGVSYLVGTLSAFFAPALADMITIPVMLLALIGEASFCLWLLVMGVNVPRWNERLAPAAQA